MKDWKILLVLFCGFVIQIKSQTLSNINLFRNLIDSSVVKVENELTDFKKIKLNFSAPEDLSFLKSAVFNSFAKSINISDTADIVIEFNLISASVKYDNPEKENFLGDFTVERFVEISGSYIIKNTTEIISSQNIQEKYSDKISASEIKEMENISLPFTQGKIPPEPFFSSLYEPIIAVSAIAVSVYLFFSVRSK